MSDVTISEMRDGELPIPYVDEPVGTLQYDGHEIKVWSLATTAEGNVIYLNCSGADASVSATLKRLLRKNSGKATFQPANGVIWSGPTQLSKLDSHYETLTQALTHQGMRLKNQCLIPDCLNIAAGLSRPLEASSSLRLSSPPQEQEETEEVQAMTDAETTEAEKPEVKRPAWSFRYLLGDAARERPPTGALFAHLKSLVVVSHLEWEATLWEHGLRGVLQADGLRHPLILPQPALGIHAWSMTRDRERWTDLVGALWMSGALSRPDPVPLLAVRPPTTRSHRRPSA